MKTKMRSKKVTIRTKKEFLTDLVVCSNLTTIILQIMIKILY